MTGEPLGSRLDALGMTVSFNEGDLVQSTIVILSVVDSNGGERLKLISSEGQSWVTRRGMLELAVDMERPPAETIVDER